MVSRREIGMPIRVGDFSMIVKLREPLFAALMLSLLRGETATCSGHVTAGPGSAQIHSGQHTTDSGTYQLLCMCRQPILPHEACPLVFW